MREVQQGPELVQDLLQRIVTLTTETIAAMKIRTLAIILEETAVETVEVLAVVTVGAEIEAIVRILREDMGIMEDRGVEAGIGTTGVPDILIPLTEGDEYCNLIS